MTQTKVLIGFCTLAALGIAGFIYYKGRENALETYVVPPLTYAYNALEPYIDEETMKVHYTKHHQTYVNNLNAALKDYPELRKKTVEELIKNLDAVPEKIRTTVLNNGGGHANHSFFWKVMTPTSSKHPVGTTKELIDKTFGSFDQFKKKFNDAALSVFGSGWAWVVMTKEGALEIRATPNQESPLMQGMAPLLGLDVWEHAYYLKYQNKRAEYCDAWWNVVNWEQVEKNYKEALSGTHETKPKEPSTHDVKAQSSSPQGLTTPEPVASTAKKEVK